MAQNLQDRNLDTQEPCPVTLLNTPGSESKEQVAFVGLNSNSMQSISEYPFWPSLDKKATEFRVIFVTEADKQDKQKNINFLWCQLYDRASLQSQVTL